METFKEKVLQVLSRTFRLCKNISTGWCLLKVVFECTLCSGAWNLNFCPSPREIYTR